MNNNFPIEYKGLFDFGIDLETLVSNVPWEQREAPRKEAFYSKLTSAYTYGKGAGIRTYYPMPIPEFFKIPWKKAEEASNCLFEACFLNYYLGPKDHLGWHADDSDVIDENRPISVISFGAEREIWFRKNGSSFEEVQKLILNNSSLLIMKAGMQQTHQHRIPKHSAECGARISLTFRGLK